MAKLAGALLVSGCLTLGAGCESRAIGGPATDADVLPTPASPAPRTSTAPLAPTQTAAPASSGEFRVLKFVFTSEVKNKEPVDKMASAEPGQRVWAHLTMRNRTDSSRAITVAFRVNDEPRSRVDLKVESSWAFRTWAYCTLKKGDSGLLKADLLDADGTVLQSLQVPITRPGATP